MQTTWHSMMNIRHKVIKLQQVGKTSTTMYMELRKLGGHRHLGVEMRIMYRAGLDQKMELIKSDFQH